MNFIFSFLIFCFVCILGVVLYRKTLKRLNFYKDFCVFCGSLETHISFFQNKIYDIIKLQNFKSDFQNILNDFLKKEEIVFVQINFLSEQEKQEICLFFKKLGRTNAQNEQNEIKKYEQNLNKKIDDIKNVELKKSKLKLSLFIMFGLFVFIMML